MFDQIKVLVIKVGKTAFCKMFQDKSFRKEYTPTEFGEFSAKITIKNKVSYKSEAFLHLGCIHICYVCSLDSLKFHNKPP